MHILVVGLGKVGLPIACYLAERGHKVSGYDTSKELVEKIREWKNPLPWEPGVDVRKLSKVSCGALGSMLFSVDLVYVIVPTPFGFVNGEGLSPEYVVQVIHEVTDYRWSGPIVIGSTLDPRSVFALFDGKANLAYNPPLIRLGHVIEDLRVMPLILFGREPQSIVTESTIRDLWKHTAAADWSQIIEGNVLSIAVAKLAINTTLASKIAWANEVAETARHLGASADVVLKALHADPRIGEAYMLEGWPASGPCLPRDLVVWNELTEQQNGTIARSVFCGNRLVRSKIVSMVLSLTEKIRNPRVAVLGVTYNPRALDVTESRGVMVTRALIAHGIFARVYDPAIRWFNDLVDLPVVDSAEQALEGANVVVLATPWPEFMSMDFGTRFVIDLCGRKS